jgi:hypothetical protein
LSIDPTVDVDWWEAVASRPVTQGFLKIPSLDIRTMLPIIALRHDPLPSEFDGTYLSRAAWRFFSSEDDCSGPEVLSDRTFFPLGRRED